jgi:hypothetical protein
MATGSKKGQQRVALVAAHLGDAVPRGLGLAAVPKDRLKEVACAAVVQELGVPAHRLGQADAPERRRAPFAPARRALGPMVGQPLAHIVQQKVGIGPDQLEGLLRAALVAAGDVFRRVAGRAAALVEQLLAGEHLRIVEVAARRDREVARIEHHEIEHLPRDLDPGVVIAAARRLKTSGLPLGAVAARVRRQIGGEADIGGEGVGGLLADRRLARLPAEAAEHRPAVLLAPDPIRPPGDAVAVGIVRIGPGEDVEFVDQLKKAEPDHRRRHPRRQHHVFVHRPEIEIGDLVARLAQPHGLATLELDRDLLVADAYAAFGRVALDREILDLAAIGRLGQGRVANARQRVALETVLWRYAEPHQHRAARLLSGRRRMAATVLEMTALAGSGVVERSEAVGGPGRARRRDPELAKDAVAHPEIELALEGHVRRWLRERAPVHRPRGGRGAGGIELEGLGRREAGRRPDHRGDAGSLIVRRRRVADRRQRDDRAADHHEQKSRHGLQSGTMGRIVTPAWPHPRRSAHWNTAAGSSRLSEPSNAIGCSPSVATTRSIDRVCAVRASIAACTTALPSALSGPII